MKRAIEAAHQGSSAVQVAYGIAAIAVAGPREAVQIQMRFVQWLEQLFSPTLYHIVVVRFTREYWLRAINQNSMAFGALNLTRKAFADAEALDDR